MVSIGYTVVRTIPCTNTNHFGGHVERTAAEPGSTRGALHATGALMWRGVLLGTALYLLLGEDPEANLKLNGVSYIVALVLGLLRWQCLPEGIWSMAFVEAIFLHLLGIQVGKSARSDLRQIRCSGMTGECHRESHLPPSSLTRVRTLHERSLSQGGASRHEIWLVGSARFSSRFTRPEKLVRRSPSNNESMTAREALRGPRAVARQIWLLLARTDPRVACGVAHQSSHLPHFSALRPEWRGHRSARS